MARCEMIGTDGGNLGSTPYHMIHDEVCGTAYLDSKAVAMRLVASMNGEAEEQVECYGSDGGDLTGTPLYGVYLDGETVGWAEQGWLTPPAPAMHPPGP